MRPWLVSRVRRTASPALDDSAIAGHITAKRMPHHNSPPIEPPSSTNIAITSTTTCGGPFGVTAAATSSSAPGRHHTKSVPRNQPKMRTPAPSTMPSFANASENDSGTVAAWPSSTRRA